MKHVITSTDANLEYAFFLPIINILWERLGFKTHCIIPSTLELISTKRHNTTLKYINKNSCSVYFVDTNNILSNNPKVNLWALAPISRLLSGCLPINSDDYVMTTDIDMLPVSRFWWQRVTDRPNTVDIFGEDGETGGYGTTRYPICYIGMKKSLWSTIFECYKHNNDLTLGLAHLIRKFKINDYDANGQRACDEPIFHYLLHQYNNVYGVNINYIMRKMIVNESYVPGMVGVPGILPSGRLDRSNWIEDMDSIIDIHCPRPGFSGQNWSKIKRQLEIVLGVNSPEMMRINYYYQEFVNA